MYAATFVERLVLFVFSLSWRRKWHNNEVWHNPSVVSLKVCLCVHCCLQLGVGWTLSDNPGVVKGSFSDALERADAGTTDMDSDVYGDDTDSDVVGVADVRGPR